jgi:predicted metal-dependent peptidase
MNSLQDWFTGYVTGPEFLPAYPYYAAVLARMQAVDDPSVPIMAVSAHAKHIWLHINGEYFLKQVNRQFVNMPYFRGVLLHEVHHVVLGHLSDPQYDSPAQPDLMELAMEISANEYIKEPLPGNPPVWTKYKQYGIAAGQSTRERYELLVKAKRAGLLITLPRWVDSHLIRGVGHCGVPGAKPDLSKYIRIKKLISDAVSQAQRERAKHGSGPGGLLAGRDPGHYIEELDEAPAPPPPRMDWKTALRLFATPQKRAFTTYTRPNRRFPGRVGEIPGRIRRPDVAKPKRLMVVIDTSGSMSAKELAEIAGELKRLSTFARFSVAECDTIIHRVYKFEGTFADAAGRGGTDLRPVFEPAFLEEHCSDGVVYFTDGIGPYPQHPPGVPTLWVLTKDFPFACPWGQKAMLK